MAKLPKKDRITIEPGIGRDPAKGRVSFKTGTIKTRKDRRKVRGDKYHEREKRSQLEGDS